MSYGTTHSSGVNETVSTGSVFGAPCWVSLSSHDMEATQAFYGAVLGWQWRTARLGFRFRYFAVADADEAVSRVRERSATVAVGPISFPPGRAALLADRDGARFGIWQGQLVTEWEAWRRAAPTFITLHTRNAFDAAIFYGEVLDWSSNRPGCCEVEYAAGNVLLRSQGDVVARIESGSVEASPDPAVRPHWQVHFTVADVEACVRAAGAHGGSVLDESEHEAVLRDPDGAQFTVTSRRRH
ncbi:VOC family protein [Streptomyces sp. NPDC048663]|uniref:VOC family protein n=1 Tax=Streptomyces sp. NPDC048663 TaxID=3155638 RepID=UPI00343B70C7